MKGSGYHHTPMPDSTGGAPHEIGGKGRKGNGQAPNGGEARALPPNDSRMPDQVNQAPAKHTDLNVHQDAGVAKAGTDYNQRMPKRMAGGRQTQPYRR